MANYPQLDDARGVWKLHEVYDAVMGGYWPNANSRALIESSDGGGVIGFVTIASTGNASVFGKPLALTGGDQTGFSSFIRGVFQGNSPLDTLEYVTIQTLGNAADFGNLTTGRRNLFSTSNETRGIVAGGITPSISNVIDYVTISSLGNATDFGDLTAATTTEANGGASSPTRAVFGGGQTPSNSNKIDFVEIMTTGNATDFGDLTTATNSVAGLSSSTRGVFGLGTTPSYVTTIQFVNIASQGNAIDYGDASSGRGGAGGTSNSVRGLYCMGSTPSGNTNVIDFFTIATGGTVSDFGDFLFNTTECAVVSDSHGGLNDGYQGTRPIPFNEAGGDLGLYFGGEGASTSNRICEINISSAGNANDFSGVDVVAYDVSGAGNKTRGINYSGTGPGGGEQSARYVEFKTRGNFADFGEATATKQIVGCAANNTRLLAGGGATPSNVNNIDQITIGTLGNAADFGDLTAARKPLAGSSSNTRAVWAGGNNPDPTNVMDYVTISTTGNAADFGDLSVARRNGASANSTTRIVFAGGRSNPSPATESNVIDYITTATTGNATDFGDLTSARLAARGASNTTRGCFMGGLETPGGNVNIIDFVTIGSTGNASDFGDLIAAVRGGGSASNGHGGLIGG